MYSFNGLIVIYFKVSVESALFHDAALLWAISRNKTMTEQQLHPYDKVDGLDIAMNTRNFTFEGKTQQRRIGLMALI